jgi:hypothetical protein
MYLPEEYIAYTSCRLTYDPIGLSSGAAVWLPESEKHAASDIEDNNEKHVIVRATARVPLSYIGSLASLDIGSSAYENAVIRQRSVSRVGRHDLCCVSY